MNKCPDCQRDINGGTTIYNSRGFYWTGCRECAEKHGRMHEEGKEDGQPNPSVWVNPNIQGV